jgi:hypothetical protein
MNKVIYIIGILFLFGLLGCSKHWDEHYNDIPETVDKSVWDAIKENSNYSEFVKAAEQYKLDTLFTYSNVYTVFVPTNAAFESFAATNKELTRQLVVYHFAQFFVQPSSITGKKKLQTITEKFSLFENKAGDYSFDGIKINFESPLYRNGKFFEIDQVAVPKPNLYEYFANQNEAFKQFVLRKDSVVLDLEKSKPIGFDENKNTIYDSVIIIYNRFEEKYFKIREEYRAKTATLVLPSQAKYNAALDQMAVTLNAGFAGHQDIPLDWQVNVLMPHLIDHGMFSNMREVAEFPISALLPDTMKNILGDSIMVNYEPVNRVLCSNGYAYDYKNFVIPDSLFMNSTRNEGEWLIKEVGSNKFNWRKHVKVSMSKPFNPMGTYGLKTLSNDSLFSITFDKGFTGEFTLDYSVKSLFPRRYLMVVRTNMYTGGIFDIYVNDVKVRTLDWKSFGPRGSLASESGIVPRKIYSSTNNYNRFDCWVDNIKDYGEVRVKFVYKGPSTGLADNGLVIDYIDFVPETLAPDYLKANEKLR